MKPTQLIGARLLGFLLVLGAIELYLQRFTTFGQLVVTERSERYGWQMLPNQERWSREGDIPEVINNHGFRDRDWEAEPQKDPGLLRVAVLGNSMTYGTSVAIEDTWPRALERHIAQGLAATEDARTAQVMNFAVQGYVLEQMERVFDDRVRPFKPDVLVVPLHFGDILPMPPSFDEFDFRYRRSWFRTSTRDLLFREVVGKWIPRPKTPPRTQRGSGDNAPPADVNGLKGLLRENPRAKELSAHWSKAGQALNRIQKAVEADGGRLAVVVLPTLDHLTDPEKLDASFQLNPWSQSRAAREDLRPVPILTARKAFGREQETMTRAILTRFGAVEGLPQDAKGMRIIPEDLLAFDERLFLQQDVGHYSPRGHRVLGDEVYAGGRDAGLWP